IHSGLDKNGQPVLGLPKRGADVSAIVIHSTSSGPDLKHDIFTDLAYGVNGENVATQGHYYIDRNGKVYRLVAENYRARHVGRVVPPPAYNDFTVGIELMQHYSEKASTLFDKEPFTSAQYASLRELIRGLLQRYPA